MFTLSESRSAPQCSSRRNTDAIPKRTNSSTVRPWKVSVVHPLMTFVSCMFTFNSKIAQQKALALVSQFTLSNLLENLKSWHFLQLVVLVTNKQFSE